MASGFLWIYPGVLQILVVCFVGMGAGVHRRYRKRDVLVGLSAGLVIGP